MSVLHFDPKFCAIWCTALVHSLWQGLLVLMLAAMVNWTLRRSSPSSRYVVLVASQVALVLCLLVTYAVLVRSSTLGLTSLDPMALDRLAARAAVAADGSIKPALDEQVSNVALGSGALVSKDWASEYAAIAYFCGAALMLCRLIVGIFGGKRLVGHSKPITEGRILRNISSAVVAMRFSYTPAIAFSDSILVPSVVGVLRPTLLLPFAVITGLTPLELELLVMHELAHIRRNDHIINLLLRIAEAFVFYHPVSWFLSRQIRHERELCCDDAVIAAGGSRNCYANSLLKMAEIGFDDRPTDVTLVQLAATGDVSGLRTRINRLIQLETSSEVHMRPLGAVLSSFIALVFLAASLGMVVRVGSPDAHHEKLIGLAIELQRDPNGVNERIDGGFTRLHAAASKGDVDEINLLLTHGADLNARSSAGWQPLHSAVSHNHRDAVRLLVRSGANINAQNKEGRTPFHVAVGMTTPATRQSPQIDIEMLRLLHGLGADVNLADRRGLTPLVGAIDRRDRRVVEELVGMGADINAQDRAQRSPLMSACAVGDSKVLSFLIAHGADPLVTDVNSRNALDALSVRDAEEAPLDPSERAECYKLLVDQRVPLSLCASAALGMGEDIANALKHDPELANVRPTQTLRMYTLLHWAVTAQSKETCAILIAHGADVNAQATNQVTPLHIAVNRKDPDVKIVKFLLKNHALVDATDRLGRTALHIAAIWGHEGVIEALLQAGADVNKPDADLHTPLHRLAGAVTRAKVTDVATAFIRAGARVDATNRDGRTPLHLAVANGQENLVRFLLDSGSNTNAQDRQRATPLTLALTLSGAVRKSMIQELQKHGANLAALDLSQQNDLRKALEGR